MLRRRYCACVLCAVAAAVVYFLLFGTLPAASAADPPVSFIRDVAPVFQENCLACHDAKKKAGKYDMTTFERLTAGGANGEPVVPGKPEESELHGLMVSTDQRRMPPRDKGEAVPQDKAAVVARWIREGAKLDPGIDPKADLVKELRVRWQPPTPPAKYRFPAVVNALAFTPDSKYLVAGGHHELTVWEAATGKLVKRVRTRAERAYGMAFLPNGKLVVAGGRPGQEGDVRVYDLSAEGTNENGVEHLDGVNDPKVLLKHLLDVEDSVLCVAASADGKRLAAGGCDRAVRVWDLSGGLAAAKLDQTVENHADWVLGVALSADGKYLVTAGRDKTAKVWDLAARESVVTFPEHQQIVYGVAVKPDGSVGFSVGADKKIRAWKPGGEGKQVQDVTAHDNDVFRVVAHPSEPLLFTSSADKRLRSWRMDSLGQQVHTFDGLTDHAFAAAVSPDGKLVAGGGYDGEVRVWTVADGKPVTGFNASPGYVPKAEPKK